MADFFDTFSSDEAEGADAMIRSLSGAPWAQPLLKAIARLTGNVPL